MIFRRSHITSCLLAVTIAFVSVQLAAARGQPPAVGTVVICTGTGPVHILVDDTGEPTGGVMICPDYAVAFYADVSGAASVPYSHVLRQVIWQGQTASDATTLAAPPMQARGPPLFV